MFLKYWLTGVALCSVLLPGVGRAAVTEDTFKPQTTGDLVELCADRPSDPMGTAGLAGGLIYDQIIKSEQSSYNKGYSAGHHPARTGH